MLLGDSITQGSWELDGVGARLSCRFLSRVPSPEMMLTDPRNLVVYSRKLDVINRGLSGYNTEWAIPVFDQVSWANFFDQSVGKG